MGGAHAHGRDQDLSAADPGRAVRLVLVAVMVAIALASLVGLWRLWPEGGKVGPVPLISLVGFAGAAASLFIKSFFGRFALGLGGLTFGVGAVMGARQCST